MFRRPRPFMRPRFRPLLMPMMPPPPPPHRHRPPAQHLAHEIEALLASDNPADRLHAVELLALRPHHPRAQAALNQLAALDPEPTVQEAARAVLKRRGAFGGSAVTWTCPACGTPDITAATCPNCAAVRPTKG